MIKKQNLLTKFFAKNKSVNQLIMKLAYLMQHCRKYQSKILMKFSNFMARLWFQ